MQIQKKNFETHLLSFGKTISRYMAILPAHIKLKDTEDLFRDCKKLLMAHRKFSSHMLSPADIKKSEKRKVLKDANQVLIKNGKVEKVVTLEDAK